MPSKPHGDFSIHPREVEGVKFFAERTDDQARPEFIVIETECRAYARLFVDGDVAGKVDSTNASGSLFLSREQARDVLAGLEAALEQAEAQDTPMLEKVS